MIDQLTRVEKAIANLELDTKHNKEHLSMISVTAADLKLDCRQNTENLATMAKEVNYCSDVLAHHFDQASEASSEHSSLS